MYQSFFHRSVGAKIALATSGALLFVTGVFLLIFFLVDVKLLSKFTLIQVIFAFVVLLLFVEVVLVILASNLFIQRPLEKLKNVMQIAEEGNFLIRTEVATADELGEISHHFNRMMAKITDLDARKIETERELITVQQDLKYKKQLEEKARIIETTNKKLEGSLKDISILYQTSQSLSRTLELTELLHSITRILAGTLNFEFFALLLFDASHDWLQVAAAYSSELSPQIVGNKFKAGEGLGTTSVVGRKVICHDEIFVDAHCLGSQQIKRGSGSLVSVPLMIADEVVGVLNVGYFRKGIFVKTEIPFLESLGAQMAIAIDRSKLYMRTKELSVTDELTGVFNRRHFGQVLHMEWKRAARFSRPISLLMIDVDHFKKFNDQFGHLKGDRALKILSAQLLSNVREVDTVARFGGEEFVVILADTNHQDALNVGQKLKNLVEKAECAVIEGNPVSLTASIGVSTFPDMAGTEEELINTADMALYQAKSSGRNRVVGYQGTLDTREGRHLTVV